jgi:DNA uptake protein ComE-like DNA-binding protein
MGERKITKSHSGGVLALILAILALQAIIYIFTLISKGEWSLANRNKAILVADTVLSARKEAPELFRFDPNTLDSAGWIKLGFTPSQCRTILKYRKKSGGFRSIKDFSKLYVVNDSVIKLLSEYMDFKIRIKTVTKEKTADNNGKQKIKESAVRVVPDEREYVGALKEMAKKTVRITDLNSADSAELVALPGIGPYFASKIISYRERLGGFARCDQLFDIYGIDEAKFGMFSSRIFADTSSIRRIKLSTATEKELASHPYIGGYAARGIIRFRERAGDALCTLEELIKNRIIRAEFATILKFYVK